MPNLGEHCRSIKRRGGKKKNNNKKKKDLPFPFAASEEMIR